MKFMSFTEFVYSEEAKNLYRENYERDKTSPVYQGTSFEEYIEMGFWVNPDYIKINGYENWFVVIPINTNLIVVFMGEYEFVEKIAIRAMFAEVLKKAEKQTWGFYRTHNNCIAYRGGSGYVYVIYDLEKTK